VTDESFEIVQYYECDSNMNLTEYGSYADHENEAGIEWETRAQINKSETQEGEAEVNEHGSFEYTTDKEEYKDGELVEGEYTQS
jgi:hypothetical protein